ncbi:hypothetical protein [Ferrovibrio sp.]|uniref:hypothetical protein n=1 Tax=Ferrovibrio sp. TaxID=1917215 RepID=UPI0025C34CCF|nr:hypothetical protein [Ferrovibrio sp.]MBX3455721.1 hypothetical protein [Ferrovibrio sp.]
MQAHYMRVIEGEVIGIPVPRPSWIDYAGARIGSAHMDDAALAALGNWRQVDQTAGYDPAIHLATGGGSYDPESGLATPAFSDRPVDGLKADAQQRVDQAAEAARLKYITGGAGQAMVYQAKVAMARAWLAASQPEDLSAYPLITAELGVNGATPLEVVTLWLELEGQWLAVAAQIEGVRLNAKADIAAAESAAEIKSVLEGLVWP